MLRTWNDPSIFYDPVNDILDLTYVDDNYLDAEARKFMLPYSSVLTAETLSGWRQMALHWIILG